MPLVIDYVPVNDPISIHIWTALIRSNGMQEIKGVYDSCGNWKKRWWMNMIGILCIDVWITQRVIVNYIILEIRKQ